MAAGHQIMDLHQCLVEKSNPWLYGVISRGKPEAFMGLNDTEPFPTVRMESMAAGSPFSIKESDICENCVFCFHSWYKLRSNCCKKEVRFDKQRNEAVFAVKMFIYQWQTFGTVSWFIINLAFLYYGKCHIGNLFMIWFMYFIFMTYQIIYEIVYQDTLYFCLF